MKAIDYLRLINLTYCLFRPTSNDSISRRSSCADFATQRPASDKLRCGPSNPTAQVKLMIDGRPLDINFKQTEMHYSTDYNSARASNSLALEHLLTTFGQLSRKLNGHISVANSSTSLHRLFIHDKQKQSMQKRRQLRVTCTATHPLLTSPLSTDYDLQLLCKFRKSSNFLKVLNF